VDPDPYVVGNKHKMGRTHTPCPGNLSANESGSDDEVSILEVFCSPSSSYIVSL
jgi:hypothetical protein